MTEGRAGGRAGDHSTCERASADVRETAYTSQLKLRASGLHMRTDRSEALRTHFKNKPKIIDSSTTPSLVGFLFSPSLRLSPSSLLFPSLPLAQELCLFHGWEVVICYRRLGRQRGLPLIWTGDHQENHIRGKACLNIAVIAAIISCCLFNPPSFTSSTAL